MQGNAAACGLCRCELPEGVAREPGGDASLGFGRLQRAVEVFGAEGFASTFLCEVENDVLAAVRVNAVLAQRDEVVLEGFDCTFPGVVGISLLGYEGIFVFAVLGVEVVTVVLEI